MKSYARASALLLIGVVVQAVSAEETLPAKIVDLWLKTDAILLPASEVDSTKDFEAVKTALENPPFVPESLWPLAGESMDAAPGKKLMFGPINGTNPSFGPLPEGTVQIGFAVAAVYLDVPSWRTMKVRVRGAAPFRLLADGEEVASRTSSEKSDTAKVEGDLTLGQGHRRLLLLTALSVKDSVSNWSFEVSLTPDKDFASAEPIAFNLDPKHPLEISDYYMLESPERLAISDDGSVLAATIGKWNQVKDKKELRLEVWEMKSGHKIWEYRNPKGTGNETWSPDGSLLLFTVSAEKGVDVYLWHRNDMTLNRIAESMENASMWLWGEDNNTLYYFRDVPFKEDEEKVYKTMWGLEDRWGGWRDTGELCYYLISSGTTGRLTTLKYTPDHLMLIPGKHQLFLQRSVPLKDRPFFGTEFWTVSTLTGETDQIFSTRLVSVGHPTISPDGKYVAFDAPVNPVEGNDSPYPDNNDNQTDLYILDLATGKAENKTREFEPAIAGIAYGSGFSGDIRWLADGRIAFSAFYMKKVKLYFFDPKKNTIEEQAFNNTAGSLFAFPLTGTDVVLQESINERPGDVIAWNFKKKTRRVLIELNSDLKRLVEPTLKIVEYDYVNSDGVTIPGFLYYPVKYDSTKKYPMVVDFYGGVIPYGYGFDYMSQVQANRGYFVYVPTPRGASGYGQAFADTHPNDWGKLTSRDMNEGVRHIVQNVPGVDGSKVAPVSGSYGGFMTMYLLSMPKDDPDYYPYATGVSGYGISNLASYWGIGWWGYLYSDMASARSYPWNNRDLYIDHSPLYRADNITVPLLLQHGDEDNNVPVGESDQMYTALKVLNREVEFIRFPGEDHGMVGKRSTYLTSKHQILEWFDKYLMNLSGEWDKRMEKEKKK